MLKINFFHKDSKSNTGAIIGGVIGGFAALIIISLLVVFIIRRSKNNASKDGIKIIIKLVQNLIFFF